MTPDHPAQQITLHVGTNDFMRQYGLGENSLIVPMDTNLACALILFWKDFSETEVPIIRRAEMVSKALESTFLAWSARSKAPRNPDDNEYVSSIMKRVRLIVRFYMEMTKRNVTTDRTQYVSTPENYLDIVRNKVNNRRMTGEIQAPIPRAPINNPLDVLAGDKDEQASIEYMGIHQAPVSNFGTRDNETSMSIVDVH